MSKGVIEPSETLEAVEHHTPAYAQVPEWAVFSPRLTNRLYRVYTILCLYANKYDQAWPKVETLAAKAGTSHQAISKTIRELASLGLVTVEKQGFPARNRYVIYRGSQPPAAWDADPHMTHMTQLQPDIATDEMDASCNPTLHQLQPVVASVATSEVADKHTNRTNQMNSSSSGNARARELLIDNIVSAGTLPAHTNRAALAQLLDTHPDFSDGEWVYEAAAAAEWFTEHERRLTLRAFGSWVERVQRRKRQLDRQEQREQHEQHEQQQEVSHGRSSQHGRLHGARHWITAPVGGVGGDGTDPGGDDWEPDDDTPWESEEERIRRYLSERAASQVG